ncbi:MAG: hypothetical protein ACTHJ8_05820 [Mucilaginibacter sp.]
MKHFLTLSLVLLLVEVLPCRAQSTQPLGHLFPRTQDPIKVYQSKNGKPVTTYFKTWYYKYWFYVDSETPIKDSNNVEYIKIYIPSDNGKVSESTKSWVQNDNGGYITSNDFNQYLFVEKSDYDKNVQDHYPKLTHGLIISAITVPLKIHPAVAGRPSSLLNANFSAGSFIGYRLGVINNTVGATIGGFFGIASLNQNSSNNTAITGTESQNMTAINYGGGLILDVSKSVQLGLVVGCDRGYDDLSTTYIYQNKPWFALAINFNILDFGKAKTAQ